MQDGREIIRIWGTADGFDIEFSKIPQGYWKVSVPPDLEDGIYAVEIHAINNNGKISTWAGELFMCDKVCHITLDWSDYIFKFDDARTVICFDDTSSIIKIFKGLARGKIEIDEDTSTIIFSRGCPHI